MTAPRPVQDSGEVDTQPHRPNGGPTASRLPPWWINGGPGNTGFRPLNDLPETSSRKYGYADNLAILLRHPSWKEMEEGLNKDMTIPVEYLQNLHPQLSVGMKMWAAYHLKNTEAKQELNAFVDNKRLVFQQAALCTLVCVSAKTLRISTRILVFSVGEHCAPAWNRSPHVKKVGSILRTISGYRKTISITRTGPTPAPVGLRRKEATFSLAREAVIDDWHILHDTTRNEVLPSMQTQVPSTLQQGGFRDAKCHPRGPIEGCMDCDILEARVGRIRTDPSTSPHIGARRRRQGGDMCREHWTILNRLRTVMRVTTDHVWRRVDWQTVQHVNMASHDRQLIPSSTECEYGEPWQTVDRIINSMWIWRAMIDGWSHRQQNMNMASHGRRLITSSKTAHYYDCHIKPASSKLDHWS